LYPAAVTHRQECPVLGLWRLLIHIILQPVPSMKLISWFTSAACAVSRLVAKGTLPGWLTCNTIHHYHRMLLAPAATATSVLLVQEGVITTIEGAHTSMGGCQPSLLVSDTICRQCCACTYLLLIHLQQLLKQCTLPLLPAELTLSLCQPNEGLLHTRYCCCLVWLHVSCCCCCCCCQPLLTAMAFVWCWLSAAE
jgi:hypothetical protein